MNFIVVIGHGECASQQLPITDARDHVQAARIAACILLAENSTDWHIIDVLPVLPTPGRTQ